MNEVIKQAIKTKDIYLIRSAYHAIGKESKLFHSLKGSFNKRIINIRLANRKITHLEAKEILIQSLKITQLKRKAGLIDILKVVIDLVSPYSWLFIKDARLNTAFKLLKEYVGQTKTASLRKEAITTNWPPTDMSLTVLEMLKNEGYNTCIWEASPTALDMPCITLDGQEWAIEDFIRETSYSAPVFSKSHVGCKCSIRVTGPDLPDEIVMAY